MTRKSATVAGTPSGRGPSALAPANAAKPQPAFGAAKKVVQMSATADLAEALTNLNYLQMEINKAHASGVYVHGQLVAEPKGATRKQAAAGLLDFTHKYIDQVDARNAELFEAERLLRKLGGKRRIAIMSANDNADADLCYTNSRGYLTVKEIKTVNSASVGAVTTHIKSADAQLGKRAAGTRKVLVNIVNDNNHWPGVHAYGNINTDADFRKQVMNAMPHLANANRVAVNGVQVNTIRGGPGSLDVKMKVFGNGKLHSITF